MKEKPKGGFLRARAVYEKIIRGCAIDWDNESIKEDARQTRKSTLGVFMKEKPKGGFLRARAVYEKIIRRCAIDLDKDNIKSGYVPELCMKNK